MSIQGQDAQHALERLPLLDGWRALCILLVLAGHLLPMGPSAWQLNAPVAATGMVIFFTLSGFLITRFLIEDGNIRRFLIRRLARIVPLAWLGMLLAIMVAGDASTGEIVGNFLFLANLPPDSLIPPGAHFWSLCLEVQFYLSIALLVAIGGKRALLVVPLACLAITLARVYWQEPMSIVTWFRADEILAGATLALIYEGWLGQRAHSLLSRPNIFLLLALLFASADLRTGYFAYLRPYICALMIGASLYNAPAWMRELAERRITVYIAQTSYALYVFHAIFAATWLGSGETLAKYAKRPLLFAATFACAHFSTFYYERRWNQWGRRFAERPVAPGGSVQSVRRTANDRPDCDPII